MVATEIVNIALENLQMNAHIIGEWKSYGTGKHNGIDGEVVFDIDSQKIRIFAEVKKNLRNHQLSQIQEIANAHRPFLLVVEHIFPKIKDELRLRGIAYLEANGNIYLREAGLYLWIDSQKPIPAEREKANRAFTKTGLRVIFHFLVKEEIVNYPYRDIARLVEVGLGNINYVMNGLRQADYLFKMNKDEYKLVNKKELVEKWMVGYAERLKPGLQIGTFRFLKDEDFRKWKGLQLTPGKSYWGGEPGGDKYTGHLRPEILTIYTLENRNEIIWNYRLIPDENGNVKVYKKFWNYDEKQGDIAPPLIIYADLMTTGENRCIETAQRIYNELLQDKF